MQNIIPEGFYFANIFSGGRDKKLASSLARHTGQVEKEVTGQVAISSPAALSSFKREQPPSPQQGSQSDVTGAV